MKFSICKKLTASLLILLSSGNYLFAHDGCQQPTMPTEDIPASFIQFAQEICEDQLKKILIQFNKVDAILEDLSLAVNNDQIKRVTNKSALNDGLKEMRSFIDMINKDAFTNISPLTIIGLNNALADIIEHIDNAVANGFNSMNEFDLNSGSNTNRITQQGILEQDFDFEAQWTTLEEKISALDHQAKNVGLAWYNKTYRKLNDIVIQPSLKHRVPQRLAMAGIIAGVATYCWWRTDRGTKPEDNPANFKPGRKSAEALKAPQDQIIYFPWEEKLREKLGHYYHTASGAGGLDKQDEFSFHHEGRNPTGTLAEIEKKIFDYQHGLMPLGVLLYSQKELFDNEINKSYNWLQRKVISAHNNLLGGAYASKKVTTGNGMIVSKEPRITFDDIVGMEDEKDKLSLIIKYVIDSERWDRGRLTPEKGYLLTGPTGTGKSYMAEALCGEIKRALKEKNRNPDEFGFYDISATIIEKEGMANVMEAFKTVAPCVLFIDEIDLLRLQRVGNSTLLNEFLISMSGAIESDPKKQIIILAATNKPENMDGALKRNGRFGKIIPFDYPNFHYRKSYLTKRLSPLCVNLDAFNLDKIALETAGCSFEQLNSVVKTAFARAKIFGHTLTHDLLEKALDSEIRLIHTDDGKDIPLAEKKQLAAHQAGHTLATLLLETTHEISKVTIRPVQAKLKEEFVWEGYKEEEDKQNPIEYGKLFTYQKNDTINIHSKEEMFNICKIQLAGHIAEELLNGSSGYTYHKQDSQRAMHIATAIVCEGLRIDRLPKTIQNEMFAKAFELINTCKEELRALFTEHKESLQAIAHELQAKLTLTAEEIEIIIKKGKLPDSTTTKTDSAHIASELGINEQLPVTA